MHFSVKGWFIGAVSFLIFATIAEAQVLYVGGRDPDTNAGIVKTFDPVSGAVINAEFVANLAAGTPLIALDHKGHLFVRNGNRIGKYDASTGTAINENFASIEALGSTQALAVDANGDVLVGRLDGAIAKFDGNTGALISASFVDVVHPYGIAVDNQGRLYATTFTLGDVELFDAATGGAINKQFITQELFDPWGVAVDNRGNLFVAKNALGAVGQYDAMTGAAIAAELFTIRSPTGLAVDADGNLFAVSQNDGVIARYDAASGMVTSFDTGLRFPAGVAIVPEPSAMTLILLSSALLIRRRETYLPTQPVPSPGV